MNSTAVKAAGAIHSDFEKKFIRAEVVNWQALVDHDGYPGVRDKGLLRLEGKEYIVKDGDVLVIRHSSLKRLCHGAGFACASHQR